ncbi:MAG: DEAD/DEAH box helicase [Opitutales bacterium]|nr:DEAD/DEAH box helicase [Opitutales bacterium]
MEKLPIDSLGADIRAALEGGTRRLAVSAPTGSGKSTRLPQMLLESLGGRILVLQPRRVAARMLAKSVSSIFGLGDAVGWHVRFDKHWNENTKIVFLTEGILARMILSNPRLDGVSAVVFDEFHERNIYADVSLALALRTQESLRPDLAIAVCSASMDSAAIAEYLGAGAKTFSCGSRLFPIEIEYAPPKKPDEKIWERAAREFDRLAREEGEGNFLIFMPGAYEIGKTMSLILANPRSKGFGVFALHGDLPPEKQDAALAPDGRRKVIVSTNVAETSLTIDGVRFVIDSGLARVARFDAARGVNTLLCERESLANAEQRAGRAGRTSPGRAVRLWRKSDEIYFDKYSAPEISRIDLSQIALWLNAAGLSFSSLKMFEAPPEASLARAAATLRSLGAFGEGGLTKIGRDMAAFPTEPRYARLLIEGARRNCLEKISLIAAVADVGRIKLPLSDAFAEAERDAIAGSSACEPEEIAELCRAARENSYAENFCRRLGLHAANIRKAFALASDLARLARRIPAESAERGGSDDVRKCLLCAFSDMAGARLNSGTLACRFAGGRRGEIRKESRAWARDIFCALEMREQNVGGGVSIMASMIVPVSRAELEELFPSDISRERRTFFDPAQKRVVGANAVKFRDLVLEQSQSGEPDADEAARLLHAEIMSGRLKLKNFDDAALSFIERVNFVAAVCPETGIAPIDGEAKSEIFMQMCYGLSSYSEVKNADVHAALRGWLSAEQLALLKYLAPKTVQFAGRKKPCEIVYDASAKRAKISSFFRDFFSFDPKKIKICDGKIKPTFELLSPGGRPVQTTQNLEEFWNTSWQAVKKELKARYPKHFKPTDPR